MPNSPNKPLPADATDTARTEVHTMDEDAPRPLSPRRERFCIEYAASGNATQAAIAAGYSPKAAAVEGVRLLRSAKVTARIAQLKRPILDKLKREAGITLARFIRENARIALADPAQLFGDDGRLLPVTAMPAATRRAIASIKVRQTRPRSSKDPFEEYVTEIKFWDKGAAIDRAIRHLGGYVDKADPDDGAPKPLQVIIINGQSIEIG